jgi:hypothetical protein
VSVRGLLVVALAALALALLLLFLGVPRFTATSPPSAVEVEVETASAPTPTPHFGEVCTPRLQRLCDGSIAWWIDSCGRREVAEICDGVACADGHCLAPSPGAGCAGLSEGGRCDGEVLRWCDSGRARSVDCSARGFHCGRWNGEPNCLQAERCSEDRCRRRWADICEEGFRVSEPCGFGETCELDANRRARCVRRVTAAWLDEAPCHGCACPSPSPEDELPPIPLVAFLVSPTESEERVRAEVDLLAYWFRSTGLRFVLRDVRTFSRPSWLSAEAGDVAAARYHPELHPADQPFFVPLVFVNDLHVGVKRASGVGTLPGTCADLAPVPPKLEDEGVVFLSQRRNLTTMAHELGHYFGLCHTHQEDAAPPHLTLHADGTPLECIACSQQGDGVCDTPVDPGVDNNCVVDDKTCGVSCPNGATPDGTNLMSYFVPCRRAFTAEQAAYLRRYARLRLHSR